MFFSVFGMEGKGCLLSDSCRASSGSDISSIHNIEKRIAAGLRAWELHTTVSFQNSLGRSSTPGWILLAGDDDALLNFRGCFGKADGAVGGFDHKAADPNWRGSAACSRFSG